jgi:hypothetical protein
MPSLKKTAGQLLMFLVSNQPTWSLMRAFGIHHVRKVSEFRNYAVALAKEKEITERIRRRLEDKGLRVMTGPFAGLKYPSFASCGSTLLPKLLGTYEKELHESIERMIRKEPPIVIDVGCAEGYYAVGIAIRCTRSRIFACDTDPAARGLCAQMAELNQVADRVTVSGKCAPETLAAHDFSKGGLVIADCEGYEKHLFTHAIAKSLSGADLVIELHEYLDRDLVRHITDVFSQTHDLSLVQSIPDLDKARGYESDILRENDFDERMLAFAEGRCEIMNWAVLSPK